MREERMLRRPDVSGWGHRWALDPDADTEDPDACPQFVSTFGWIRLPACRKVEPRRLRMGGGVQEGRMQTSGNEEGVQEGRSQTSGYG